MTSARQLVPTGAYVIFTGWYKMQCCSVLPAMTIADLEDRIALVDLRLNAADALELTPAQRQALWRERVNLMQSLLQVEYAQLQSPGY